MMNKQENDSWTQRLERWRSYLDAPTLIHLFFYSLIIGLIFVLYHLVGNTDNVKMAWGRSVLLWMVDRWRDSYTSSADYSHGWFIPLVSLVALWMNRKPLMEAPKSRSWSGLAVVALALVIHWVGARAQQPRISLFSLVLLLWGLPYFFGGWSVARLLVFPCGYLLLCIPLNFLDSLTFPLRMLATSMSVGLLNGIGIPVQRSGSAIFSSMGHGFSLDVADPCSGIRSIIALTAMTGAYAYFTQKELWKKWVMFFIAVPLAIMGNIGRIVTIALAAQLFGQEAAMKWYHDLSGYIVFFVAVTLMMATASLINMNLPEIWKKWKNDLLRPVAS